MELDLDPPPVHRRCLRCSQAAPMRFAGVCEPCRDELRARSAGEGREVAAPVYEPKINVTPNAVALKDD
jgi:hypothetical protein